MTTDRPALRSCAVAFLTLLTLAPALRAMEENNCADVFAVARKPRELSAEAQKCRKDLHYLNYPYPELVQQFETNLRWVPDARHHLPFRSAYVGVIKLLSSCERTSAAFDDLALEAEEVSKKHGNLSKNQALHHVLACWEQKHGFGAVKVIPAQAGFLAPVKFNQILKDKQPMQDLGAKKEHGFDSHRLQWHVVMRAMSSDQKQFLPAESSAEYAQDVQSIHALTGRNDLTHFAAALYAQTGSFEACTDKLKVGCLDWSKFEMEGASTLPTVWDQVFDRLDASFSSPNFIAAELFKKAFVLHNE
jgi:hypothetical protein